MSSPEPLLPHVFRIGPWLIDGNALTATRGGEVRALEPKGFQVARYLATHRGRLITIDELMDACWAGAVVTPNAVTRVIAHLRKALDDDARNPLYIETVSRTGYRCTASVELVEKKPRSRAHAMIAAAFVLAAATVLVWMLLRNETASELSVAVLPFDNLTGEAALDYLSDGVAEEIIHSLTQIDELTVRTRNQTSRFRGSEHDLGQVADSLAVAYLVGGSIRRHGEELRFTARLIDPDTGTNLWSTTEQRDVRDVFAGQDAIASGIAVALADITGAFLDQPAYPAAQGPDPAAYDLYLRGRYIWHRRGSEPLQPAIDLFLESVRIDPDFARGWSALATAYLTYPSYSPRGYRTWNLAEDAAKKALELDPTLGEPYSILATFAQYLRRDWVEAETLYREGIERDPSNATVHYWYAEHLGIVGKHAASLEQYRRTLELDPTYQAPLLNIAFAHLFFRDIEGAAARFEDLWNRGHRTPLSWFGNFMSFVLLRDEQRALAWLAQATDDEARIDLLRRFVAVDFGNAQDEELVADLIGFFERRGDYPTSIWIVWRLGGDDELFAMLNDKLDRERPVDTRPLWGPGMDLMGDPRFVELMDRLDLIDYWETTGWGDVCRLADNAVVCDDSELTPDVVRRAFAPMTE